MLRIYDKLQELTGKAFSHEKLQIIIDRLGEVEPLTRIEFQIRRNQFRYWNERLVIHSGEVNTVEDWHHSRAEVVDYLMSNWIRYTEDLPDRENNHQDRVATWQTWDVIKNKSLEILRNDNEVELERPEPRKKDGGHLLAQSLGCVLTYIAENCPSVPDEQAARCSTVAFENYAKAHRELCEDKYRQLQIRKRRRASRTGINAAAQEDASGSCSSSPRAEAKSDAP
jgi:hypothetical protein